MLNSVVSAQEYLQQTLTTMASKEIKTPTPAPTKAVAPETAAIPEPATSPQAITSSVVVETGMKKTADRPHWITITLTIVFGLLSPVLAVVALLTSRDSLLTSQKSLTVSQTSLEIAQRAYLTYGVVDEIPSGIKVHISNFGHVPATIIGGPARYMRNLFPVNVSLADISRKFSESTNKSVISPGDTDAAFLFDLPKLSQEDDAAVKAGHQIVFVSYEIDYETGFNKLDRLSIRISYAPDSRKWTHVNSGTRIDFGH